jgi:hypothetical protein
MSREKALGGPGMLAYVFWHWRYPSVEKTSYQKRIIDFQETLNTHKPSGFLYSAVFEIEHVPWAGGEGEAYEEWYVLDNSAALDVLNEAAVTGPCKEPHNQIAIYAAGGTGGLYRFSSGKPDLATARVALWFAKPAEMTYENFYALLQPEMQQSSGSLWQRQMTLGPTPEFCWHSSEDHSLPAIFVCLKVPLTQIWSRLESTR